MGQIFVARDEEVGREVALKRINKQSADAAEQVDRFQREAEITARLEHPGIVPVYGVGTYASGRPFYAMRLIRGESFEKRCGAFHQTSRSRRGTGRGVGLRRL